MLSKGALILKTGIPPNRKFSTSKRVAGLSTEDLLKAKKQKSERISQQVEISIAKLKSRARERHVPASRMERVGHFGAGALSLGKISYINL